VNSFENYHLQPTNKHIEVKYGLKMEFFDIILFLNSGVIYIA